MASRILILLAHPTLEKSRVHARLVHEAAAVEGVTVHDLYQEYPDFDVAVEREKALLLKHDVIIWQHPFYWYSGPPLLKQWIDLVLEHGWAYGKTGKQLEGKKIFNVLSTGGQFGSYQPGHLNRYDIPQFLLPFDQTAVLCNMEYWPPFVINGTHLLENHDIDTQAQQFGELLRGLAVGEWPDALVSGLTYMNELFTRHA
ncbi:MAG: NAD(P)H-dependent oxidoreductase [Mucilaginibacter polytrichastri]|nr:NAD(P)H-dependent oxidoreductase [Mucilaginibacter polytrichastri]